MYLYFRLISVDYFLLHSSFLDVIVSRPSQLGAAAACLFFFLPFFSPFFYFFSILFFLNFFYKGTLMIEVPLVAKPGSFVCFFFFFGGFFAFFFSKKNPIQFTK